MDPDPDPGGPKTYGSCGSGSAPLVQFYLIFSEKVTHGDSVFIYPWRKVLDPSCLGGRPIHPNSASALHDQHRDGKLLIPHDFAKHDLYVSFFKGTVS